MTNFLHHACDSNQSHKYCSEAARQLFQIQSDVTKIRFFFYVFYKLNQKIVTNPRFKVPHYLKSIQNLSYIYGINTAVRK